MQGQQSVGSGTGDLLNSGPLQLPWLLTRVYLQIAGFTIRVTSAEPTLDLVRTGSARRFLVDPAPADVQVRVLTGHLTNDDAGEPLFDSGGPWRLYRHDRGFLFRFVSSTLGPCPYKIAVFSPDFTSGEVCLHRPYLTAGQPVDPLDYPLDELLVINLLSQGRGIAVHACGLIDRSGAGYLFAGQSGAGKTTMARLWLAEHGTEILSDDRVVLRGGEDGVWMYGTPWHGDEPLASPRRVRLAHLFFLRHDGRHELAPLTRAEAVARLFASSFAPFSSTAAVDFTLRFIESVVRSVPCHELRFAPVPDVIDFVRRQTA